MLRTAHPAHTGAPESMLTRNCVVGVLHPESEISMFPWFAGPATIHRYHLTAMTLRPGVRGPLITLARLIHRKAWEWV